MINGQQIEPRLTERNYQHNHQLMIRPFSSADEMVAHHVTMYGSIGQIAAETVLRWATLWPGLNPLDFRIVLAPDLLAGYNWCVGYTVTRRQPHAPRYIVGTYHICRWEDGTIVANCDHQFMVDFLVHEMTHHRQADILDCEIGSGSRGTHRDRGWYGAIAEAAPNYLGVKFPTAPEQWPKQKQAKKYPDRLTEVETCHWPHTFRELIAQHDPRLLPVKRAHANLISV